MTKYQEHRTKRRYGNARVGRFKAGKLAPVMALPVRPSEGGVVSFGLEMELDPIEGRMLTPMFGELTAVFVPVEACDYIRDPAAAYAGMREVIREKLLSGAPLFGLEDENEISKRCGVTPRSIGGVNKVCSIVRLAHNAGVNYLRQRKYHKAALLLHSSMVVTPALVTETVLERFRGVLDPDDRINGAVQLDIPNMDLPVRGIGLVSGTAPVGATTVRDESPSSNYPNSYGIAGGGSAATAGQTHVHIRTKTGGASAYPDIVAKLNGVAAGNVSLLDFYNAQKKDGLIRIMDQIIRDNPEFGYEMVARWCHGLSVDSGHVPFVIYEERQEFNKAMAWASDTEGVENDVKRTDGVLMMSGTVPVPKTELGGVIVFYASFKPDETIPNQPDPFFSEPWGVDNFVADELALDPQPVTLRELDSEITAGQEATITFYTGKNQLKAHYSSYGLSRQLDPMTIEHKTVIWQLQVPLSVTPDNIRYPEVVSQYPFKDQNAEVVRYKVQAVMNLGSPMVVGPTPIENVAVVDDLDLFDEV